ncbi:unnamed protein product [Rhizophagus irregularis]|uniref:Uncharacterized protein n=1 Tax=Rhizophagus irregularis TaxID=588596 RepID=A0A2I1GG30_9GLOM|nr:hypothetical protein RhiirA4_171074 [Rhizophagus irregularis]CAB4406161.1 unnamed protein product [Rhizophagus irregularis]
MSAIVSSSCTDNGSVSRLSNGLQDASITGSSSKTLISNIEQGRRNTTNSFRSSPWTDDNREWDNFFQQNVVHGNVKQEFPDFFMSEDEEEEEFRQEWSDEHFTQLYVQQQHSLNLDKLHTRKRRHSTSQNSFVQEFLQNSNDTSQKITNIFCTNHCDLFQAQLYFIDHLLTAILTCPITTTRRPSSTAEWNWDKLFSPTRWYDKDHEDDDDILQNEYLKHVAIERLQLLLGHLIVNTDDDKRKEGWEWEWEFYNSYIL